tara:strand:- start:695 stop:2080 length:1386 start_codon:yes stop_codon:yes gene_type:complete
MTVSLSHIFLLFFTLTPLLLSNDIAKEYSYIFFLIQLLTITLINYSRRHLLYFLSPVNLLIYYVNGSFLVASLAFVNNVVFPSEYLMTFDSWRYFNISLFYVLITTYSLFYLDYLLSSSYKSIIQEKRFVINKKFQINILVVSACLFIVFFFFPLSVGAIGGSGNMSYVPMAVASLNVFYLLAVNKMRYRLIAYLAIIGFFAIISYSSKREAIFFIFPLLLIEAVVFSKKVNLKEFVSMIGVGAVMVFLILGMSVMRGYGSTGPEDRVDLISVLPAIIRYIGMNDFIKYFLLNIEVNYTFFHSFNAMEFVMNDTNLVAYGSTIYKTLFIIFPRSLFSFIKPDSFIHLYTYAYSPSLRAAGGSYPPNLYAEMFWNFHFSGFVIMNIVFFGLTKIYAYTLKKINQGHFFKYNYLIFIYLFLVTYYRGSGLDMFAVYAIFALLFSSIIYYTSKLLTSSISYQEL